MTTASDRERGSAARLLRPLGGLGVRAATATVRPLGGMVSAAGGAAMSLERQAVDRVLGSEELERMLVAAFDSPRIQSAVVSALSSETADRVVDGLFNSGLIDRLFDRLLASDSLWHLIDEIAASPAVTAAISQQGLGFADQMGDEVRDRSHKADDWFERAARRLVHRRQNPLPLSSDPSP